MATKEPKPPKEKKIYYSSRGGAGRSKSVGPATRKPSPASVPTPSKMLEVPIPTNKTTSTGRGGSSNYRTFVVEEGTFERVMDAEVAKIKGFKADEKRKTISLRGGAVMPQKKEKTPTRSESSGSVEEADDISAKSIVSRFPGVPSFSGGFFRDRERSSSPASSARSTVPSVPSSGNYSAPEASDGKHCPTCQCRRHTALTNISLGPSTPVSPTTSSPPPSPFRQVFPGVLLYAPEGQTRPAPIYYEPPSPSSSIFTYYRDAHSDLRPPSPEPHIDGHQRK
ncbi:hypothetical protein FRC14_003868 [Serendipita sp. 396]|nr:hypothetical protein FRC14_003868 [Serendipita sp. 396]KAG8789473.1 hypothetical protein FRC15_008330 [Serendipita sp. 397]KAG8879059.1 hypothetical protein FRC20_003818 [Serendipita sp. 405]